MSLTLQILWGSGFLGVCLMLHTFFLAVCVDWLGKVAFSLKKYHSAVRVSVMICLALWIIVLAHTVQVWIWAVVWMHDDVLANWNEAIYFSLVTYTSLGYGDIVLPPQYRVFAAFASVTGLLGFGLSTALLVALMGRLMIFVPKERPLDLDQPPASKR